MEPTAIHRNHPATKLAPRSLTGLDLAVILFLASAGLGILPAYDRSSSWLSLAVIALGAGLYFAISRLATSEQGRLLVARDVVLAGGVIALYFVTQYGHYPILDKVETVSRLARTISRYFPSWVVWAPLGNSVATLLEGILFLAGGLVAVDRSRGWKIAAGAAGGLILLALLLSESRGAWLAVTGAGLIWLALYLRPARWLAYLLGAGLLGLVILVIVRGDILVLGQVPLVDRTLAPLFIRPDRLDVYRGSISLIQDAPLTGIGLGLQFAMNYSRYVLLIQVPFLAYSHNFFLETWLELGLPGIAALIWIVAALFYSAWQARKTGDHFLLEAAWVGFTAMLLHGVTDGRQYVDLWCWLPFFLLVGLVSATLRERPSATRSFARWIPAGLTAAFVVIVMVALPSLPSAWRSNLGALQQASADLSPGLVDTQRDSLRQQAEQDFQQAAALDAANRTARLRLGLILNDRGEFEQARQQLEIAYQLDPHNPGVIKALGLADMWTGRVQQASILLQDLPDIVGELNNWGWWRGTQNQPDLSRYAYQVSLLLNPDQPKIKAALDGLEVK